MLEREGEWTRLNMHFRGHPKQGLETNALLSYESRRRSLCAIASTANSLNILWLESIFVGANDDFLRVQLKIYKRFRVVISRDVVLVVFGILNELKYEAGVFRVEIIDKSIISVRQKKHQGHTQHGSRLTL